MKAIFLPSSDISGEVLMTPPAAVETLRDSLTRAA